MWMPTARDSRFLPTGGDTRSGSAWPLAAVLLAFSMSLLTVVRLWRLSAPYPPGLDGAQWLSYGRALFGGVGRSAESTYAPLIPILTHGLSLGLGPVLGLRLLATSVLVLLAAAVWLLSVRVLGVTWGSLTTALVVPCTAMAEPFFYGGYPQQASLAFGILGVAAFVSASRAASPGRQARSLACASISFMLASACHLLFGPLLLAVGAIVAFAMGVVRGNPRRFLQRAASSLAPPFVVSLLVALTFFNHGYSAPLAGSHRSIQGAWAYATRESPELWALLVVGSIAWSSFFVAGNAALFRARNSARDLDDAVFVGFALALPVGLLFIASGQPRLVPPLLLGSAILAAFASRRATRARHYALPFALVAWSVAILWLASITTGYTRDFSRYYQVLDASLMGAARSVPATNSGAIAVAADRRGWPVGWWVEALQERPVLTGSNPQWLAFPEERVRASAAMELFAAPNAEVLQQRAEELGVTYLLMRKWDWIGWERWVESPAKAPTIVYDDDETLVLEIYPAVP